MQRLNLAHNQLKKVPHEALAGLTYLETLEMSDNPIIDIKNGDFNGMSAGPGSWYWVLDRFSRIMNHHFFNKRQIL